MTALASEAEWQLFGGKGQKRTVSQRLQNRGKSQLGHPT